ncbi:MAG: hypothetical protein KDE22_18885 [Rhodobacterales bacterium]|nr:hypothetical protein [Rhodobacterales bacterium]
MLLIDGLCYLFFVKEPPALQGLYRVDDETGYGLTPNFEGRLLTRGPSAEIRVNSRGFRGPEWALDGRPRILIAGDSFTFGLPLDLEHGFVAKTAQRLPGAEVLNLGVPGYGPIQIARTLARECGGLKPRHVFYMYYYNDTRIDGTIADYKTVFDGYLVNRRESDGRERTPEQFQAGLAKRTSTAWKPTDTLRLVHIRTYLSERGIHPRQVIEKMVGVTQIDTDRYVQTRMKPGGKYSEESVGTAARQIEDMASLVRACGARFTMVILPGYGEAYYHLKEPATERLLELLDGRGLDILDLRQFTRPGVSLISWYDAHYSDVGTDMVGNVLGGYLAGAYPDLLSTSQ